MMIRSFVPAAIAKFGVLKIDVLKMTPPIRFPAKQMKDLEAIYAALAEVSKPIHLADNLDPAIKPFLAALHPQLDQIPGGHIGSVRKPKFEPARKSMIAYADLQTVLWPQGGGSIESDLSITYALFGKAMTVSQLMAIGACAIELNYKASPWKKRSPEEVTDAVLYALDVQRLPIPSFVVSNIDRLYCVWLTERLPRTAIPELQLVQWWMSKALNGFTPATHRGSLLQTIPVVGSANSSTRHHSICKMTWCNGESDSPKRNSFSELASVYCPPSASISKRKRVQENDLSPNSSLADHAASLADRKVWATRLDDLQQLRKHRYSEGPIPDAEQEAWVTFASLAVAHLCPLELLDAEVEALCQESCGWVASNPKVTASTCYQTAIRQAWGQFNLGDDVGSSDDPLTNEAIAKSLKISSKEARTAGLKILLPAETAGAKRAKKFRIARGGKDRGAQREQKIALGHQAITLGSQGMSRAEIAKALGASTGHVSNAVKAAQMDPK